MAPSLADLVNILLTFIHYIVGSSEAPFLSHCLTALWIPSVCKQHLVHTDAQKHVLDVANEKAGHYLKTVKIGFIQYILQEGKEASAED